MQKKFDTDTDPDADFFLTAPRRDKIRGEQDG
jgi:hypothetical protein